MTAPIFRFEDSYIALTTGLRAPNYPVRSGLKLHSYTTEKYGYTVTSRMYGTTRFEFNIKNIKYDDYDAIRQFWEDTLTTGYDDMSIIDNKGRILFESSWLTWRAEWSKRNGGVYNVLIDIESSVPWTLPCLAGWTFANDDVDEFTKSNSDLTISDGVLVDYTADTNILRQNGSALKLTGDSGVSQLTGATCGVNWATQGDGSVTIFCQFRRGYVQTDRAIIAQTVNSSGTKEFTLWQTASEFGGRVNGNYVGTDVGTFHSVSMNTWYDCAITYDAHNGNVYVYLMPTDTSTSFTTFMDGDTAVTDGIGSYMSTPDSPDVSQYTTINLLKDDTINGLYNGSDMYLQNVFFFNGFLTPMDFNTLRRLCFMWNNKTGVYPK